MRQLLTVAASAVVMSVCLAGPASGQGGCGKESKETCNTGAATDAGFGVTIREADEETGTSANGAGKGPSGPPTKTKIAPTCTGNSPYGDLGVLCNAALTCPDESEVRFWKWQQQKVDGEWTAWRLVDTVCLGADDPQIDPAVAIPGIVQRDFQSVVVMKGAADVTPKPDTLVNIATKFRTDAPASYDIPLTILGQSVVITAKAETYTWYFGDGDSGVSTQPDGYLEHTYRKAATQQAYVVITWSGTFTVNGGASQAINGTVSTTGNPVAVAVREARSELVRD